MCTEAVRTQSPEGPPEDAADELLDSIILAVRARLSASEDSTRPDFALASGEGVTVELQGSRWSVSASDASSVIRGASVSVNAEAGE